MSQRQMTAPRYETSMSSSRPSTPPPHAVRTRAAIRAGFCIRTSGLGELLIGEEGYSVYSSLRLGEVRSIAVAESDEHVTDLWRILSGYIQRDDRVSSRARPQASACSCNRTPSLWPLRTPTVQCSTLVHHDLRSASPPHAGSSLRDIYPRINTATELYHHHM